MDSNHSSAIANPARLEELFKLRLLDTPPEEPFDRLTRLAARTLGAPTALVSLVDNRRQFFKSSYGMSEPWKSLRETPVAQSLCQYVVSSSSPLVVEDMRQHPVLRENPASFALGIISYLGVPLTTASGHTLGSFCVMGDQPIKWRPIDLETMTDLAASVMSEIALRHNRDELLIANSNLLREAAGREAVNQELRHSEFRLHTAQRLARIGSFELHTRPRPICHWTVEAIRIMGVNAAELPASIDEFVENLVHADDRVRVAAAMSNAILTRQTSEIEYRVCNSNGSTCTLLTAIEPEQNSDGSATLVCTALDVTERYAAEAALAEYRNELWHVARVATVGEMATVLAHEINQPLAAISHTANACVRLDAKSSLDRSELARHLATISAQARRASEIIKQLRNFVRKQPATHKRLDLNDVVDEILGMLAPALRNLNAKVVRSASSLPAFVRGEQVQLGQLILNLVRNAMDAIEQNPDNDRQVEIRVVLSSEGSVVLEIDDNGPGIPSEAIDRIFEPFFTTRSNGLGMGLPISSTIAETHGAVLSACNRQKGAMFRVCFPPLDH